MSLNKEEKYVCLNTRHRETNLPFPCSNCSVKQDTTDWETEFDDLENWDYIYELKRVKYAELTVGDFEETAHYLPQKIKSFIESVRQKAQQEERERISEKVRKLVVTDYYNDEVTRNTYENRNEVARKVLKIISNQ